MEVIAIWTPSFVELMVVLVLALLLFGKRLPEVARSLGKGIVEFKKGVKGVEDDVDSASSGYTPSNPPTAPPPPPSQEAPSPPAQDDRS